MARLLSQLRKNLSRKEVNHVKYTKPEVILLESATAAVQSTSKGVHTNPDNNIPQFDSPPAYEADE
jgi:hypothetical protein